MFHVLVVDGHAAAVRGMNRLLRADGHSVVACASVKDALRSVMSDSFDIIITDLELELGGDSVLETARRQQPGACIVVVSVRASHQFTRLVAQGAYVVAEKPLDYAKLLLVLTECRARRAEGTHREALLGSA